MAPVGIEAMSAFCGSASLDVTRLARHRQLNAARFDNLMMHEKTVALPCEDPVTFGVNAAAPIVEALAEADRQRIELLITCSESGIDFGKSISTYIHHHLRLSRNCRLFEIKQACYSGTAGFQMAVGFVLSQVSPGAKALVVATDVSRFMIPEGGDAIKQEWSFAEPSSGAGAVAMLISDRPHVFQADVGANGYYGYEVMDTCRPVPHGDAGDAELSLLSYLDCCESAYAEYQKRVRNADFRSSFHYLSFHTPFGGMVRGAHRTMMRKVARATPNEIEDDFRQRVMPGLKYCQRVGNIMGGTVFLSLASTIDHGTFDSPRRIGCFSYGSGCCSEFYSGVVTPEGQKRQREFAVDRQLADRHPLSMDEYDELLRGSTAVKFGTRNVKVDDRSVAIARAASQRRPRLVLREIKNFHREYEAVS
jgi:polyketide biosynthesis 3-hydroxy-3-methylglutaryl-CoA synthase-like enzyme PksG